MVHLLFTTERIKPASRWAFWRYQYATVHSWINEPDLPSAKSRIKTDMQCRGWRISGFEVSIVLDESWTPPDSLARNCVRLAKLSGTGYYFLPDQNSGRRRDQPEMIIHRGAANSPDDAHLELISTVDPLTVPASFRHLLDFALVWAIGDDVRRSYWTSFAPMEERRRFFDAYAPYSEEIEQWCSEQRKLTPEPVAAVIFDWLAEAASEVEAGLHS